MSPRRVPVPSLIKALAGSGSLPQGRYTTQCKIRKPASTSALCFLNPEPLRQRELRGKWGARRSREGSGGLLGWGGETAQGPGKWESTLVLLRDGAGGPRTSE